MSTRVSALIFTICVVVGASLVIKGKTRQPIRFNHNKHIEEVELSCDECHIYVNSQTFAGFPDLEYCLGCHEEPQTDSNEEEKLRSMQANGIPLVWQRINEIPEHVYFSHRRHVIAGELDCSVCHGQMADRKKPPTKPAIKMDMDHCIDCHLRNKVDNDCLTCHR